MIALSGVKSSPQAFIRHAILFLDTSDNALYNQVHCLIGTTYLSIVATNDAML